MDYYIAVTSRSLLAIAVSVLSFACFVYTAEGVSAEAVYISRQGVDSSSCGARSSPCKSIFKGVYQVRQEQLIYIDGTDTDKDPYTCENMTSQHTGIYADKSLALIGYRGPVYTKCSSGMGIFFTAKNNASEIMIKITDIHFENSPLFFVDCSVQFDKCSFTGYLFQPVSLTQATQSVNLSITNSVCFQATSCFGVTMETQNPHRNHVTINIKDSVFSGILDYASQPSSPAGEGMHVVMATGINTTGELGVEISLSNVTVVDCNIGGPNGFFFVDLPHGSVRMNFDNVTLRNIENARKTEGTCVRIHSRDVNVLINNTLLLGNFKITFICLDDIEGKSSIQITNSKFDGNFMPDHMGIITTSSKSPGKGELHVKISKSKFLNDLPGNIFSLESSAVFLSIQECSFEKSIFVVRATTIVANIENSRFLKNREVLSLHGETVFATIKKSVFDGQFETWGFIIDINCSPRILNAAKSSDKNTTRDVAEPLLSNTMMIDMSDTIIQNCEHFSVPLFGFVGDVAFGNISIRNTIFRDIAQKERSARETVVVNVKTRREVSVAIINTTFQSIYTSDINYAVDLNVSGSSVSHVDIVNTSFVGCTAASPLRLSMERMVESSTQSIVTFTGCRFTSNRANEGALAIDIRSPSQITFTSCTFAHNKGDTSGGINLHLENSSNITFTSCAFLNNTSLYGSGGGLSITAPQDQLIDTGCIQKEQHLHVRRYRKWRYRTTTEFIESKFQENVAQKGLGGAVSMNYGRHIFQGCHFENNFAAIGGGHLGNDGDSTSIEISNSTFKQTRPGNKRKSFISTSSAGPLIVKSTLLKSDVYQRDLYAVLRMSRGGLVEFSNDTFMYCGYGNSLKVLNFSTWFNTQDDACYLRVTVLEFNCRPCPAGQYSLQQGHTKGLYPSEFQCLKCPYGAECTGPIKARKNFWGYKTRDEPPALNFTVCPLGYCEVPKSSTTEFNACQGNRAGILCGCCKMNYTETLISSDCRLATDCYDTWFIGVALVYCLAMALYLITKPPIFSILLRQILWFKRNGQEELKSSSSSYIISNAADSMTSPVIPKERKESSVTTSVTSVTASVTQDGVTSEDDKGYLKIVFYFYQASNLLLVSTSFGSLTMKKLLVPLLGLFNFQFHVSADGLLCPFPGLNAVTKQLLMSAQVFVVLGAVILWYLAHRALCAVTSRQPPSKGPYLAAAIETLLLGYAVLVSAGLKLLYCVSIAAEDRLFIAGEVKCYNWWQYMIMVVVFVNIVPFIFVLAYITRCLNKGTISAKHLIIAYIFPLPFFVYRLLGYLYGNNRYPYPGDAEEWAKPVQRVLYGCYRASAVYWESVLIGRRFVLISLYVAITDPLARQVSLSLVCLAILLHHSLLRPFQDFKANASETASLFSLVVIAMFNVLEASFMSLGRRPVGILNSFITVSQWVQVVLFIVAPTLLLVMIMGTIISQVIRLLFAIINFIQRYRHRGMEQHALLEGAVPGT